MFGGNPKVVIAEPEITVLKIKESHDFLILGCDGIFDTVKSSESIECIWNSIKNQDAATKLPEMISKGVESLVQFAIKKESSDNLTVV